MAFEKNSGFERLLEERMVRGLNNAGLRSLRAFSDKFANGNPPRTGKHYWKVTGSGGTELAGENKYGEPVIFRHIGGRTIPIAADDVRLGALHIASREGEPPALLTGTLRRRTAYRVDRSDLKVYFGSNATEGGVNYPKHLAEKMGRTGWAEAIDENSREIMQAFRDGFQSG